MTLRIVFLVALGLYLASSLVAAEPALELATFKADVTPPVGDGPCVGFMPKVASIEHPLEIRGIVLRAHGETFVLAALDYEGLCNSSYDEFRQRLARAAGTTPERVALQSLHQHTAPVLDAEAVQLLHGEGSEEFARHVQFTKDMAQRSADAIRDSLPAMKPVTRIVGSRAKVDRVASNRRVPLPDGSIAVRLSSCRDPKLQAAPEGLIDPWLRTVTFLEGERPLAQLHYYATHPQSFYGDARISWDVPGMARQRLEREGGVFQVYFNGCGGNVAMGKYNDGSREAREELATRLSEAMQSSAALGAQAAAKPDEQHAARVDAVVDAGSLKEDEISWKETPLHFTPREDPPFSALSLRQQLEPDRPFAERLKAAMYSAWAERLKTGHVVSVSRLALGPVQIVNLPGEPFVEFQLFAQQHAASGSFVCVAGYGECGMWYFGPDSIYADRGGYEQTWSFTGPCQKRVEEALLALVRPRE